MQKWKVFSRAFLFSTLILVFGAGVLSPRLDGAEAAPVNQPLLNCPASVIDEWTFTTVETSSSGAGVFTFGSGITDKGYYSSTARSFSAWDTTLLDPTAYVDFRVDATGKDSIGVSFNYRSTSTGPSTLEIHYSTDGVTYTKFDTATLTRDSTTDKYYSLSFDLSSVAALNNSPTLYIRLYAYGASGSTGTLSFDIVTISSQCILPPPGTGNISITHLINGYPSITSKVCEVVIFEIAVTNDGADATNITVTGDLTDDSSTPPINLEYISASDSITIDSNSGVWTWTAGDMAAGEKKTLSITAKVKDIGLITSHAEVVGSTNPTHSADTVIDSLSGNNADLAVSQSWTRSTTTADTADLTLTVENVENKDIDTDNATGVYIEDILPSGLTYVSSTPSGAYSSSTGIWSAGDLNLGDSTELKITVKVDKEGDSTNNEVRIKQANQCDLITTNNEDTTNGDVHIADLSLIKSGNNAGTISTITVSNAGPDDAYNVQVKVSFAGYTYISDNSSTVSPGGTFTRYDSNGDSIDDYGIWSAGDFLDGQSKVLTITTSPNTAYPYTTTWAEVIEAEDKDIDGSKIVDVDSIPNNCSVTSTSPTCAEDDDDKYPIPLADLQVTIGVDDDNPDPEDVYNTKNNLITYTLRVTNLGDASATNLKLVDLLPAGISYVTYTKSSACLIPSGMAYNRSTGIWTVGTLAKNECAEITITAKVSAHGKITNTVSVYSFNEKDPNTYNNSASVDIITYRAVVINEVAWTGTHASAEDEWIELYNPSSADMLINGWKLKMYSSAITDCKAPGGDFITLSSIAGKIAKGSYYLLERGHGNVTSEAEDQIYYDTSTISTLLPNDGATLCLFDDKGNFIDTANYEGRQYANNPWSQGGKTSVSDYSSMERQGITPENDSTWITNAGVTINGRDADNDYIYGTPKKKNSTPAAPTKIPPTPTKVPPLDRLVINEFLARPGYDWNQDGKADVFDEFIEIKNIGVTNVKLNGWQIDDEEDGGSAPITFGNNVTLKPGDRVVYYGLKTNILLSDGGDTVRLINPKGKVFDTYTYSVVTTEDQSVCRLPDGNGTWYEDCVPTPGLPNTREGVIPVMGDVNYQSPVCSLPDTLPADFLYAECRGYGANIWRMYWDVDTLFLSDERGKWESFVQ